MSTRADIIDRLIARLQTVVKSAGYSTNLGAHVEHWRQSPWQIDDLPACNVKDTKNEIVSTDFQKTDNNMLVDLNIDCSSGSLTIDDAYEIINDVYTALALEDTSTGVLNRLARELNPLGEDFEVNEAENTIASITIHLQIIYEAVRWTY